MLGNNYEKMGVISPTTKEWPQSHHHQQLVVVDEKGSNMDQKPAQEALKCPRCDSSNTKFCYYNNYSLTQPRHFCKACKRYWTRGGTLRNVPVGGGCRKNKRVKRPNSSSSSSSIDAPSSAPPLMMSSNTTASTTITTTPSNPNSETYLGPLFYGNPNSEVNLLYPNRFGSSRVSGYEHLIAGQAHLSGLGLGFSSGNNTIDMNLNPSSQVQDAGNSVEYCGEANTTTGSDTMLNHVVGPMNASNSFLSSYSAFGPSMSSLIATYGLQGQKFSNGGDKQGTRHGVVNHIPTSLPFEDMQISGCGGGGGYGNASREAKVEEGPNRYQMEQISSSDPSIYWNNAAHGGGGGGGAWPDLANIGSSVTSLI